VELEVAAGKAEIKIVGDKGGASVRGKTRGPAADKLELELADRLMGGCRKEQETVLLEHIMCSWIVRGSVCCMDTSQINHRGQFDLFLPLLCHLNLTLRWWVQ